MLKLTTNDIVIYPTDTVYGIGADATNKNNYLKINMLKKHTNDKEKPLSVMFHDFEQMDNFIDIDDEERLIIQKNWNRGFTFLVEKKMKKPLYFGKSDKIGIRIADTEITKELTKKFPIISTSCNFKGQMPAKSIKDIPDEIKKPCKIIDGGILSGTPSTIIDLSDKKTIRRGVNRPIW